MSSELSVAQILANLEKQVAFYKEKEAYHAEQEAFHREQRAVNAAELEAVSKHYEAFKARPAEVNRRYRSELKRLIDRPTASTCLRRLVAASRVRVVKKGTAHVQAVYTKA